MMEPELYKAVQDFSYSLMVLMLVNALVFFSIICHMAFRKPMTPIPMPKVPHWRDLYDEPR